MFLSIDGTLAVQIVNFIVFIVLLNIVFLKPVGAALKKRRAYLDSLSHDVESAQAEVAGLRGRADEARAAARREAEASLEEYRSRADAIVAEAQAAVAQEIAAARGRETEIVDALAGEMIDRAVGAGR